LGLLDRVVDLRFGSGEASHHIILELYSQGNIILTDRDYVILALIREHQYIPTPTDNNVTEDTSTSTVIAAANTTAAATTATVKVAARQVYPVTLATTLRASCMGDDGSFVPTSTGLLHMTTGQEAYQWVKQEIMQAHIQQQRHQTEGNEKKNKNKKSPLGTRESATAPCTPSLGLKALLLRKSSGVHHYGPSVIDHCILSSNLDPNMIIQIPQDNDEAAKLVQLFQSLIENLRSEGKSIFETFYNTKMDGHGYILYTTTRNTSATTSMEDEIVEEETNQDNKEYMEFLPHLLLQHRSAHYIQHANFNDAVDAYFSCLERQILRQRYQAAEQAAKERLSKIKQDQCQRLDNLLQEQSRLLKEATLVEHHAEAIDKALMVVNSALPCMSWDELDQLIEMEKCNKNPIALLIHKLEYERDIMVLDLPYDEAEDGDDLLKKGKASCFVKIKLFLTAHANARSLFDKYRLAQEKYKKTSSGMTKAFKAAESVVQKQLQEVYQKQRRLATTTTHVARKINWFEKFHWFITSDNYLVIGGRDAQQNELLVKRYLRPGDAYLHADVHGAASCILRSKRVRRKGKSTTEILPLSEIALREAGNFTLCLSSAWSSKIITSAWWVESHQVSKTAPTGEYLTVGSFMIRGRKNFLPPCQLEMGLAVFFRLGDESSIARHANERRDFALLESEATEMSTLEEIVEVEGDLVPVQKQYGVMSNHTVTITDEVSKPSFTGHVTLSNKSTTGISSSSMEVRAILNSDDHGTMEAFELKGLPIESDHIIANQQSDASPEKKVTAEWKDSGSKQKRTSVRDRKLIKKYGNLEAAKVALQRGETGSSDEKMHRSMSSQQAAECDMDKLASRENNAMSRGKKGKIKKAAKKYAEQDDEDRDLAMLALQGGKNKHKSMGSLNKKPMLKGSFSDAQEKAAADTSALLRKDPSKLAGALDNHVQSLLEECVSESGEVQWDKFDADVLEQMLAEHKENQLAIANRFLTLFKSRSISNFSASLSGIIRAVKKYGPYSSFQSSCKGEIVLKEETQKEFTGEAQEIVIEGKTEDDAVDDTADLSKFTGLPMDDDTLLYAIPVCAPYSSLNKYMYKVKLTPGSLKRGKAVKQCLEIFLRPVENAKSYDSQNSSSISRARDLIKAINEPEWVQAICGDVKIAVAGARKIAKSQKLNAKKGNKSK
jgi:predicted ribosome quality control (RQC) complex YloA/Tae2 family protein